MARATSSASTSTTTTTTSILRQPSTRKTAVSTSPSDIALFLTNLRLLDLDRLPDWPDITLQTFGTKDAAQSQKTRIRCVEWALFRLFELWDPADARDKLKPFFPPLEPLQSLNLRAALYRSLNELKKEGVLGRECLLRKTMLDDCKGERLFEILATFSGAVLRKVAGEKARASKQKHGPAARRLALAQGLSGREQASLLPLAIGHRASLKALLRRKEELRARIRTAERELDVKKSQLEERTERCKHLVQEQQQNGFGKADADAIKRQIRDNWLGSEKWLNVLVEGDADKPEDRLLASSFGSFWNSTRQGLPLAAPPTQVGLLENLQSRVHTQQERLGRWRAFHAELQNGKGGTPPAHASSAPVAEESTNSITFRGHQRLTIEEMSSPRTPGGSTEKAQQYDLLIENMKKRMAEVPRRERNRSPAKVAKSSRHSVTISKDHVPEVRSRKPGADWVTAGKERHGIPRPTTMNIPKKLRSSPERPSETAKRKGLQDASISAGVRQGTVEERIRTFAQETPHLSPTKERQTKRGSVESTRTQQLSPERSAKVPQDRIPAAAAMPTNTDPIEIKTPQSPWRPSPPPSSEPGTNQRLADDIIFSVAAASPSPVKGPRPSLAERTRMSMAPKSKSKDVAPPLPSPALPKEPIEHAPPLLDRRASLLDRTRQSMSLTTAGAQAPSKEKKELKSKPRHSRGPTYPVNQFETPRRDRFSLSDVPSSQPEEEKKESTPKELLFSEEAEYASVFKSRPKVAMSPTFGTPAGLDAEGDGGARDGAGLAMSGIDSAMEMGSDDSGFSAVDLGVDSPLGVGRRKGI